ncbi:hypothetical protein Scep_009794 [Stephania cephalantha]|uniref:Pectin acetylesterase n=1 Tax=Stephania cephalantha TaxID=152367 RepID=A0AAP0JTT9_9MAGN
MDGAGPSQPQPPPPPPPPPPPHDQQQPPQIDPADPPQQGDNVERETQEWLPRDEQLELNQDGFSPIRITAINGDIELVRELLKIDSSLCSLKDRDDRTHIHLAAMKGRLDVMGELLLACPESVEKSPSKAKQFFHLVVKSNQFEAFKVLLEKVHLEQKEVLVVPLSLIGKGKCGLESLGASHQSVALSVGDWFFDRVGVRAIDCPYPCDNTCHNLVFK